LILGGAMNLNKELGDVVELIKFNGVENNSERKTLRIAEGLIWNLTLHGSLTLPDIFLSNLVSCA
jgi:hypothetical protein